MNKATLTAVETIAQRMIIESTADKHTCTQEINCASCKKMHNALQLLLLIAIEQEAEEEDENEDEEAIYWRPTENDLEAEARYYEEIEADAKLELLSTLNY
jgi:hypothetical protein